MAVLYQVQSVLEMGTIYVGVAMPDFISNLSTDGYTVNTMIAHVIMATQQALTVQLHSISVLKMGLKYVTVAMMDIVSTVIIHVN
jgi:hypothetical protein